MNALKARLEKLLDCKVDDDPLIRRCYSVDASFYRITPQVVVFPEKEGEVVEIVRFAGENGVSVSPRGAGTGLVGSALGKDIVLDFKKMNKIRVGRDSVTVQPGVIKGVLDEKLSEIGKFFAPDPSVGRYCSIGGMIGTNASGSHALKYGSVIDNILEVAIIDGNGNKIRLPGSKKASGKILSLSRKIDSSKFPKLAKNSCGYRLDSIQKIGDAHKIMAGSEGTLGIITSAKFKIHSIPKKRSLVVISYRNIDDIHYDVNEIVKLGPSALEFLDGHTIGNIRYEFPKDTIASLFVEVDDKTSSKVGRIKNSTRGRFEMSAGKNSEIQKWWNWRNSALAYSLRTIAKNSLTPHIIEDSAIPVTDFKKIFEIIDSINKKFKTKTIVYGHAGSGNLHVRLIVKKRSREVLKDTADMFFEEIIRLGGTITAEHGDGMARSGFVKRQYGKANYGVFKELKGAFDPKGILNPGKIIAAGGKMVQNLEY